MKKFLAVMMLIVMTACVSLADDGFEPAGQSGNVSAAAPAAAPAVPAAATDAAKAAGEAAKDATAPAGEGQPAQEQKGPFDMKFMLIIVGVMVLMIFMSSRAKKKQERQRKEMIESLKKGDKVVTIGGICGTILEARPNEIVVKVDENTKMKFARWAVRAAGEEVAEDKKKDTNDQQENSCCNNS